ncbi:MAG: sugar phosphate isomerase/epimerase family protein [Halioglobus sp.]
MGDTSLVGELSLCWGSMEGLGLRELAETAAAAGFAAITLNPPMYQDARASGLSERDIQALLEDLGVRVSGVDPLFSWLPGAVKLDGDDPMSRLSHATPDEVFHIAQVVGTDIINAPLGFTQPESQQETIDSFGALCEQASSSGLRVTLEFMPFTDVPHLAEAYAVVNGANCDNGGIMFDCWHHHRSGGTAQELAAIAGNKIFAVQLDDALEHPMDDVVTETLNHRLLPGEGCIDLTATLQNLKASGARVAYDVEVFKESLRSLDNATRASTLFASANAVLAAL